MREKKNVSENLFQSDRVKFEKQVDLNDQVLLKSSELTETESTTMKIDENSKKFYLDFFLMNSTLALKVNWRDSLSQN